MPIKKLSKRLRARNRRRQRRSSRFESLEPRRMLATAIWNNVFQPLDVSGDSSDQVTPLDALVVINELNQPKLSDPLTGKLPRQTDTPQSGPYVDVSCDGSVSPIDALLVINGLNNGVRGGGDHDGTGTYKDVQCSPQLLEGQEVVTQLTRHLALPNDHTAVEVIFQVPEFDQTTAAAIRDAWEIEVRRADGTPIVLPHAVGNDAVLNWSEGLSPVAGPSADLDLQPAGQDSKVTINLAGEAAGTVVDVSLRLVNNDADDATSVLIRGFEFADVAAPPPFSPSNAAPLTASSTQIDLATLTDVTGSVVATFGRTALNGQDDQLSTQVQFTNEGDRTVRSELIVAARRFSSLNAHAFRPDGFTPDGEAFFVFPAASANTPLRPGDTTVARDIGFLNKSNERFSYEFRVLGRVNAAPTGFATDPLTLIGAGQTYRYAAQAVDPDDSEFVYQLVGGPEAMTIDANNGVITWETRAENVGGHRVVVRATDPFGAFVEQSFAVQVQESLANRPPIFTSDPVTEAIAASGFEIDTVAVGATPAGAAVVNGVYGPRVVSLNQGASSLTVLENRATVPWHAVQEISTGDPPDDDAIFDMGYAVNLGLQPWTNTRDANEVAGMDQGDLNGDGIIDLVALTWQYNYESRDERHEIVRVLGDGNGQFSAPQVIASWPGTTQDGRNVVIADVDGDGDADVLAVERSARQLVYVPGTGGGEFGAAVITELADNLSDFRVTDVDEDGRLDLIGRNAELAFGATYTLMWMRGNGDGTFAAPQDIGPGGSAPNCCYRQHTRAFAIGDFNQDGHIDVTTGGFESKIQVYHGDGAGGFTEVFSIDPAGAAFARGPDWMEVADFTGDGFLDIAFYHTWEERTNLLVGDATGAHFVEQVNAQTGRVDNFAAGPAVADIDGDGDLDIVAANGVVRVLRNDGTGDFDVTRYEFVDFGGQLSDHFPSNSDTATGAMFGDYNRDGVVDFAFMTEGDDFNGVGIRLGTRPGEFGASRSIPAASSQENDTLPADFNGDGIVDVLAIASASTFLGRGDGTFNDPIAAFGVRRPYGNASVADFNMDGLPDFVATAENRYFVGLSNGDGTFTISQDEQVEGNFYGISATEVADFNADGYPDFIAKASVERTIDVYLNQAPSAPGTFVRSFRTTVTAQGVNVQGFDQAFAVGDFDGDQSVDFVAVDQLPGEPMKLVLFAGDSAGSFVATNESFVYDDAGLAGITYSGDVSAGDLNEDGVLDVVSFTNVGPRVHLGNGDGSFRTTDHYLGTPYEQRGRDSYIVDIDGDGHLDLVQALPLTAGLGGAETLNMSRGVGDGTFLPPERVGLLGTDIRKLHFADLDHDGHLDVLHPTPMTPPASAVYAGVRDGLVDVTTVDLNADGNDDVLAINENNDRVKLLLGDRHGRFTRVPDLLTGRAPKAVTVADLDGNGTWEIVTANRAGRSLTVFNGSVDAGYTATELPGGNGFVDVVAADLDRDGQTDLIALDDTSQAIWIFRGTGSLTPEPPVPVVLGDTPGRMFVADVDADGILDVGVTLANTKRLAILSGDGSAGFAAPFYVSTPSAPSDLAIADLNADGLPDLIATLPATGQVSVHYNRGAHQFARAQLIRVGAEPQRVALADADQDGQVDVIVVNQGDDTVSVIYSRFDPNQVYRYDADAMDPDGDPLAYRLIDGPGGMLVDEASGEVLWAASPTQVGIHQVTLLVDDGRGGTATQSYFLDVRPPQDNAPPIFAAEPPQTIGAADVIDFRSGAVDADGDPLRYRLIDGPTGAAIDPTTGEVHWDGRSIGMRFGRGGQGSDIRVPPDASLKPDSITIEGWFNLFHLNRFETLMRDYADNRYSVSTYETNRALRVAMRFPDAADNLRFDAGIEPMIDRWYHLAFTYDATTGTAALYVDGVLAASATTRPQPLALDPDGLTYVADNGTSSSTRATIDNYRIWNYARSASEIEEGLARQYDGDPRVVLDYRFDGPDTLNVRDHSSHGNTGYRTANGQIPMPSDGLADAGLHHFVIAVEDGRGGIDQLPFDIEVVPALRASINGHLFDDLNRDGDQDDGSEEGVPSEPALAGWHVFVDENHNRFWDAGEPSAASDVDGYFELGGLLPGEYVVEVIPVAGYVTLPPQPIQALRSIVGELDPQANAVHELAIQQLTRSQISGQLETDQGDPIANWDAYLDVDGDGSLGPNEPVARSDANGRFTIGGLAAGTYRVRVDLPPGWTDSAGSSGQEVTVLADDVVDGIDFIAQAVNSTADDGVRFFTVPSDTINARDRFRYAAVARSLSGAGVEYDLPLAPDGMVVDSANGTVSWRPTMGQIGRHRAVLRATTPAGSSALQEFSVDVAAPNTAPVIVRVGEVPTADGDGPLVIAAHVDRVYAAVVNVQDADGDALQFAMVQGPPEFEIDPATGALHWLPTHDDVGVHEIAFEVSDAVGNVALQQLRLEVDSATPPALPIHVDELRTRLGVNQPLLAQLHGVDQLARRVEWSLLSGPASMVVDQDGTIRWTPSNGELGAQTAVVQWTTADGDSGTTDLPFEVVGRSANSRPVITSVPKLGAVAGHEYRYDVVTADADHDLLAFQLLDAPAGMSLHPSLGTLRWTPSADELGEHRISLQVADSDGATAVQSFELRVTSTGTPPRITSIAPAAAAVGTTYLYTVTATDAEGDPLIFHLLAAPSGMNIVAETGEVSWTPTTNQIGAKDVAIEVVDGVGGTATQAFRVRVSAGEPNRPPVIESDASRFATVGVTYEYQIVARDPENQTITYALGQSPVAMQLDAATGAVVWVPEAQDVGKQVVTLIATDVMGASAIESYEIDVLAANRAPEILSTAPDSAVVGAEFSYQTLARDADADPLRFELPTGPDGAQIDAFGRITWRPKADQLGDHDFAVMVSDPRQGSTTQTFTVTVVQDSTPPLVSLIERPNDASRNILPWQGPFRVYARAIDNVEVASLTLSANGRDIPLDANGMAVFTFEDWTFSTINVQAAATDTSGNVATASLTFDYDFPEGWSGAGTEDIPEAVISAPAEADTVYGTVSILGTAAHPEFDSYKLSYRRVDETQFHEIAAKQTAVVDAELGVWDTTLLENAEYVIRLEVATTSGVVNTVDRRVGLSGALKLGNFRLSFTDLAIPVSGIPVAVTRVYDSLRAERSGEFGYGWRLEYRDTDLRVGVPSSGLEDIGIFPALRPGVKVYLNVPGEGRQGFTFDPDIRVLPGWGGNNLVLAQPRFRPDPGVTSQLSAGVSGYLQVNDLGELYAAGGIPYHPASPDFGGAFQLQTAQGIVYRISGVTGKLLSATDRNGNQVTFTEAGITSADVEVTMARDAAGRIVAITDPRGKAIRYDYDTNGNFAAVRDREDNQTRYVYRTDPAHFLADVIDPLGRTGNRSEYDSDGRLIATLDLNGNRSAVAYDADNQLVITQDRLGNESISEYDQLGNIVRSTDPLGRVITRDFDGFGRLISETDASGNTTHWERDAKGNIVKTIRPDGSAVLQTYTAAGQLASRTDARGFTEKFEYDEAGNLVSAVNALGVEHTMRYDTRGNLIEVTDAVGNRITHQYDRAGNVIESSDPLGNRRQFSYDANGKETGNQTTVIRDGVPVTLANQLELDAEGNLLANTDAEGFTYSQSFDALGRVTAVVDQVGREFAFSGLDHDVPEQFLGPDGATATYAFDAEGRVIGVTNQDGAREHYVYDAVGNVVERILPDDTPATEDDNPRYRYVYDAQDRQIVSIDPTGAETHRGYDLMGNLVSIRDAAGHLTTQTYDAASRLTSVTDPLMRITRVRYDGLGQISAIVFPDASEIHYEYDTRGNRTRIGAPDGTEQLFAFDANNRLTKVTDAEGNETEYSYDELGNLIAITNPLGQTTRYRYDGRAQRTAVILPDGSQRTTTYGADLTPTQAIDFAGNVTTYEYDQARRVTKAIYGDGTVHEFTYDGMGRRTSATIDGRQTNYQYDLRGRLIRRVDPDGSATSWTYDAMDRPTRIDTPLGATRYSYTPDGRLAQVFDVDDQETTYQYDAAGRLLVTMYPNGVSETRHYDALDRIVSIDTVSSTGGSILELDYQYDVGGNLSEINEGDGRIRRFAYNRNQWLVGESIWDNGVLTSDIAYGYDAAGNRVEKVAGTERWAYAYDQNSQLLTVESPVELTTYTYDGNGNRILKSTDGGESTTYDWNAVGQLVSVQTPTAQLEYAYDADGQLVSRTQGDQVTLLRVDSSLGVPRVIDEYRSDGSAAIRYTYGVGPISQNHDGVPLYYHTGRDGTVLALTDAAEAVAVRYRSDAFGKPESTYDGPANALHFLGKRWDGDADLTHLGARYLDNSTGRFLGRDPAQPSVIAPLTAHPYIYGRNNPNSYSDPSGESFLAELTVTQQISIGLLGGLFLMFQQQFHSKLTPITWKGFTASYQASDPVKGLSKKGAQVGNLALGDVGLSAGPGLAITGVVSSKFTQTGQDKQFFHAGIMGTIFAGVGAGISAGGGIGIGGIEVESPNLVRLKDYGHAVLAGGYALVGLDVGFIAGLSFGTYLFMGTGRGSANGLSGQASLRFQGTVLAGVSIPGFGDEVTDSQAQTLEGLIGFADPKTYVNAFRSLIS